MTVTVMAITAETVTTMVSISCLLSAQNVWIYRPGATPAGSVLGCRKRPARPLQAETLSYSFPREKRHALEVKVSRLRREPKDALIARLISLESTIAGQRDAENRLRGEILRLSTRP